MGQCWSFFRRHMLTFAAIIFSSFPLSHRPKTPLMPVQNEIQAKLQTALAIQHLEIENESHRHGGPATESHFKITVVSEDFAGLPAVQRHRRIYELLAVEMAGPVHALALHLYTPQEWRAVQQVSPASPDCRGGSKAST